MKKIIFVFLALSVLFIAGCKQTPDQPQINLTKLNVSNADIKTFNPTVNEICTEDGKPIIRLFSTTTCPHCKWIASTYDDVVKQYVAEGKIVAYHWEFDTDEDTLSGKKGIPQIDKDVNKQFNPRGFVPTYVFGCKYYRIGNGYEREDDLEAEAREFKAVIEQLLEETQQQTI